jgi:hypothetical protein
MKRPEEETIDHGAGTARPAHRVRLPGFLAEEEIGLGDVIKRVTYAIGIKPCAGCESRAATLNRWVTFTR